MNEAFLPRSVLLPDNTILVANDDRKLEIRSVTVERAEPRKVYISAGVEEGELVITTSLDAPIPGTQLTVSGEELPETQPDGVAEEAVASTDAEP